MSEPTRPCEGKGPNVCMAEGCFGRSCRNVAPTVPASRVARDTLALIADLPGMDEAELDATEHRAARNFTALVLHRKLPVERQGDQDARAWEFRQEWQDAAEALWLAVQAERRAR